MINQPVPRGKFLSQFKKLVGRKHAGPAKDLLLALTPDVAKRYKLYKAAIPKLEMLALPAWSAVEFHELEKCYAPGSKYDKDLQRSRGIGDSSETPRCPYCQIDNARSWDHFLPTDTFPEFSVFGLNLVRSCTDCNSRKLALAGVERRILNPFFDDLSSCQYLRCVVRRRGSGGLISTRFFVQGESADPSYDAYVEGIAISHFKRLGLERKIRAESVREFSGVIKAAKWNGPLTEVSVRNILTKQLGDLVASNVGVNSWERVFREALLLLPRIV